MASWASPIPVDRTSARWLRLRSACQLADPKFDLDQHADHVWLTVEAFTNNTGNRRSTYPGSAAVASQETS